MPRQPAILSHIFEALAQEDASSSQRGLWTAVLSAVADSHLHALHAHAHQFTDWISCLPSAVGRPVLDALLPLVPLHADFGRQTMLLLRKSLVAPETRARALAVHGLTALLERGATQPDLCAGDRPSCSDGPSSHSQLSGGSADLAQADLVLALRSSCTLSPALQAYTYDKLRVPLARGAPTDPAARALLYAALLEPLAALATSAGATLATYSTTPALDAAWAASLLRAAARDASGGVASVVAALARCLTVIEAMSPPPMAVQATQHAQICTALHLLREAMRPANLTAALLDLTPSPASARTSHTAHGNTHTAETVESSAVPSGASGTRALSAVHALSTLGFALSPVNGWEHGADGPLGASLSPPLPSPSQSAPEPLSPLRAARHSPNRKSPAAGRRTGSAALGDVPPSAAELQRGALLCGCTNTRAPLLAACKQVLAPALALSRLETSSDAGRVDGCTDGVGEPRPSLMRAEDALCTLAAASATIGTCGSSSASSQAGSVLLCCHALACLTDALTRHAAVLWRGLLLGALHGAAYPPAAVPALASSSASTSVSASSAAALPTYAGSSSVQDAPKLGHAAIAPAELTPHTLRRLLTTLLELHAATRAWGTSKRRGPAYEPDDNGRRGRGGVESANAASGGASMPAELRLTATEQEECSLLVRTACLALLRTALPHSLRANNPRLSGPLPHAAAPLLSSAAPGSTVSEPAVYAGEPAATGAAAGRASTRRTDLGEGASTDEAWSDGRGVRSLSAVRPRRLFASLLGAFETDLRHGLPIPLLHEYLALIEALADAADGGDADDADASTAADAGATLRSNGTATVDDDAGTGAGCTAATQAAVAARAVVCRYEIEQPAALRPLLGLITSRIRPPADAAAAAADIIEAALAARPAAPGGTSSSGDDEADNGERGNGGRDVNERDDGDLPQRLKRRTVHDRPMLLSASAAARSTALQLGLARFKELLATVADD